MSDAVTYVYREHGDDVKEVECRITKRGHAGGVEVWSPTHDLTDAEIEQVESEWSNANERRVAAWYDEDAPTR